MCEAMLISTNFQRRRVLRCVAAFLIGSINCTRSQLSAGQCDNVEDSRLNVTNISPQIQVYDEEFEKVPSVYVRVKVYCPLADVYYIAEDNSSEKLVFTLPFGTEFGRSITTGDIYFATVSGRKDKVLARHSVTSESHYFPIVDYDNPPPPAYLKLLEVETAFFSDYRARTGVKWQQYFGSDGPRRPPRHHMWSAPYIGHKRTVKSDQGLWHCGDAGEAECQSIDPLQMEIITISQKPKIFFVPKFFNDVEADEIIRIAAPRMSTSHVGSSTVMGPSEISEVRISQTGWIHRDDSPILDSIFRRAADLLKIDESRVRYGRDSEDMQVVHYVVGGKYNAHLDWEFKGKPPSRFVTLLMYLRDPIAGGETSFPFAGIKVVPKKGSAVFFYNLLEDGNADELTKHAAMPVIEGEKWLSNIWIWDS